MTPRQEHDALVAEARARGGLAGCLQAGWAGNLARDLGLDANPFDRADAAETLRAEFWERCRADGLQAEIPTRAVQALAARPWRPRPGSTHAAHTAAAD